MLLIGLIRVNQKYISSIECGICKTLGWHPTSKSMLMYWVAPPPSYCNLVSTQNNDHTAKTGVILITVIHDQIMLPHDYKPDR